MCRTSLVSPEQSVLCIRARFEPWSVGARHKLRDKQGEWGKCKTQVERQARGVGQHCRQ